MENKQNINQNRTQGNNNSNGDFKVYKITIIALIVIIGALVFMLLTTYQSLRDASTETEEYMVYSVELQNELDSLMYEYTVFKHQHDSILHDKDSVIQKNAREIERLIAQQGDYRRIRRQLDYLRDNYDDYVHRIDSLYRVAEVLRVERDEARREVAEITDYATELEKDREILSTKVEVASALRADQIKAKGYRVRGFTGREVEMDRADRIEYVRVCFTLAENPIAPAGQKNVYLRIARPDESIIRISDEDAYSFVNNGDTLQFTVNKQITYNNRAVDVCMTWDRYMEYMEGEYLVSIFTDEHHIGEAAFTLR